MLEALDLKKWKELKGKHKIDFVYELRENEFHCTADEGEFFVIFKFFTAEKPAKNLHSFDLGVFDADLVGIYIGETEYEVKYTYPKLILSSETNECPRPK